MSRHGNPWSFSDRLKRNYKRRSLKKLTFFLTVDNVVKNAKSRLAASAKSSEALNISEPDVMNLKSTQIGTDTLCHVRKLYSEAKYDEAEKALFEFIEAGAKSADTYCLLADIQHALVRPDHEARALEQALAAGASAFLDNPEKIWLRLGVIRASQGDHVAAVAAYKQSLRIKPDQFAALYGLAQEYLTLHDLDAAYLCIKDLKSHFPHEARTHLLAGHIHKALGSTAQAQKCYYRALAYEPELGEALYNLVEMDPPGPDNPLAASAAKIASHNHLPAPDRINAGFALARIFDQSGRYAEAFEQTRRANNLARNTLKTRGVSYVPELAERRIARAITEYPVSSFHTTLDPLPIEFTPVFVFGLPRSGTTLIEQIITSHKDVQTVGERSFARQCELRFRKTRLEAGRTGPVDPSDKTDAELLAAAREQYIEDIFACGMDGSWIVDKLPANYQIAGFLRAIFPNARLVHSMRDPRATCFSLYWSNFHTHEPWYHNLMHIAHYYRQYSQLMKYWQRVIPGPYIEVDYEDLVHNPQEQITGLLHRIGLPFDSACLTFYDYKRPILTASHAQVRRPIYTGAIDHWRHYAEWLGPVRDLQAK